MKIKTEVSNGEFSDWFQGTQYENNFTPKQLTLLYDYDYLLDESGYGVGTEYIHNLVEELEQQTIVIHDNYENFIVLAF